MASPPGRRDDGLMVSSAIECDTCWDASSPDVLRTASPAAPTSSASLRAASGMDVVRPPPSAMPAFHTAAMASRVSSSVFVGRQPELALVTAALDTAGNGGPGLIL